VRSRHAGPGSTERAEGGIATSKVEGRTEGALKMTLGLMRGVVRLVEHDAAWADEFRKERDRLAAALVELRCAIEHIGSTAVADLPAKPILDIALGYGASVQLPDLKCVLERLGYEYRGDSGDEGGYVFARGAGDSRTHHLHAVLLDGAQWRTYLKFRDLLRTDPKARALYSATKGMLASQFERDRPAYTTGKSGIVRQLLAGSY
jgi:GrpB-like predicted nucleotidyltransferase (UPF0157 family)